MKSLLRLALLPAALLTGGGAVAQSGRVTMPESTSTADLRGAPLNPSEFRYARPIPAAPSGPARLLLDVEALSRSNSTNDLRIVDASNNQIPFLLERMPDPLVLGLNLPRRAGRDKHSVYTLSLPYDLLPPGTKLVVTTEARVFTRTAELRRPADDSTGGRLPRSLATATWSNADPEHDAPPLTFDAPLGGTRSVELFLDEGDNAPLPLKSARLLVPALALRYFDPGTPLRLLYGNPNAAPPRYDLELLASRVFGEPARDVVLPPPQPTGPEPFLSTTRLFWAAVAIAVIALFAILAKLIGGRSAEES